MGRIYLRPQDRNYIYAKASATPAPARTVGLHTVRGISWGDFAAGDFRPGEEEEMFVLVARFEPGMVDPLHHFDQPDLICILSGRMTMGGADSDEGVELPAGSVVYLDASEDFW